jgi:hypothetical protein
VVIEVIWEINPEFKELTMDQILAFARVSIVGKECKLNDPYQSGSIFLYPQSRAVGYLKIENRSIAHALIGKR